MGLLETGREEVVSVDPDTTVSDIAQIMFDRSVGSVLVQKDGHLEGIITDRDLVTELLTDQGATNLFEESSDTTDLTARDVMTPDPVTVDRELEFAKVLRQMSDAHARRIPIVDDDEVVGIVTLDDCLVRIAGESTRVSAKLDSLADVIRSESPDLE